MLGVKRLRMCQILQAGTDGLMSMSSETTFQSLEYQIHQIYLLVTIKKRHVVHSLTCQTS